MEQPENKIDVSLGRVFFQEYQNVSLPKEAFDTSFERVLCLGKIYGF